MRIALVTLPDVPEGEGARLGGQPVAWHQLQSALALACERIVCLAAAPTAALAAMQREAERGGARFSVVAHPRALSGLVNAADTLFVFAPGVLPDREWLLEALGGKAGVAVLPAERGIARGYERIDRDRAWAGVLATRGDAVEALAELPPDADPAAGLLRVALQRGARSVEVPEAWFDEGRWAYLPDRVAAVRFEPLWFARRVPDPGFARPSDAMVYRIARAMAARWSMQPLVPPVLAIVGALLALGGGAAGYLGHTASGLGFVGAGVLIGAVGAMLRRIAGVGSEDPSRRWIAEARETLHDLALVAIASSPSEFAGWPVPFAALVLVAVIRLARQSDAGRFEKPFGDRGLVLAILCGAAAVDQFPVAMVLIGLIGLAIRLFAPKPRG